MEVAEEHHENSWYVLSHVSSHFEGASYAVSKLTKQTGFEVYLVIARGCGKDNVLFSSLLTVRVPTRAQIMICSCLLKIHIHRDITVPHLALVRLIKTIWTQICVYMHADLPGM